MKANIVPIGNSKGIRIPKTILEECKIQNEVLIKIEGDTILIKPVKRKPRKNWEKSFQKMHGRKEDALILDDLPDVDTFHWEW